MTNLVEPIKLKKSHQKYMNCQKGVPAVATNISIDTPMSKVQRGLYRNDLLKYIEKAGGINWDLFGVVTAVKHKDGSMEIINGQHRMTLVKTLLPKVTEVPAHIIDLNDEKDAFRYFGLMNGGASRNVSNEEQFWALVLAEDTEALKLKDILEDADLACGQVNEGNKRPKVKYTNFKKATEMGIDACVLAAHTIRNAYPDTWNDNLYSGLTRLFSMDEYKAFLDEDGDEYKTFDSWLTQASKFYQISDLQFRQYRDITDWSYGIAYGLMQKFMHHCRNTNANISLKVDPAEQAYKFRKKDTDI